MTLTYEDTRIEPPKLTECLQSFSPDSLLPILLKRRCKRRNCYVDGVYVGFVIVWAYTCTDVWYVDLRMDDMYITQVLAAIRYWLLNDLCAEGMLMHISNNYARAVCDFLGAQCLSTSKDVSLCWCSN